MVSVARWGVLVCVIVCGVCRAELILGPAADQRRAVLECSADYVPDRIVVHGGVSVSGVRPLDVSAQLDRVLRALETYAVSRQGIQTRHERLRGARNPQGRGGDDEASRHPFMELQVLDLEFPAGANIDEILEQMFKLGLDRYGNHLRIDQYEGDGFKSLVGYRIAGLEQRLRTQFQQCLREAAAAACGAEQAEACMQTGGVDQAQFYATSADGLSQLLGLPGVASIRTPQEHPGLELDSEAKVTVHISGLARFPAPVKAQ